MRGNWEEGDQIRPFHELLGEAIIWGKISLAIKTSKCNQNWPLSNGC